MKFKRLALYLLICCNWLSPLYGKEAEKDQPVLYYADTQTHDRELGILILKGNVEFNHKGSILEADYVSYNEKTDIVIASGSVRLRQPDGEINFVDYLELTGDMKEGVVLQLRTLLEDDSKIVATEGRKYADRQELDQMVYTPCELCGNKIPTWQINTRHATKDDVNQDLIFTDAEFRFLDIPLMYLPYATQPLKRRSGFIPDLPKVSSDFGAIFKIPYYVALSDDSDMTLTPVFFTKKHPMFIGEYRQAFGDGQLSVEGSITHYKTLKDDSAKKAQVLEDAKRAKRNAQNSQELQAAREKVKRAQKKLGESIKEAQSNSHIPEIRGHIFGTYEKDLNDIWRLLAEGGYVSDKTYFRKYKFSEWRSENALTSKLTLEGFLNQRDYAAFKAYHFQGLRVEQDHQKHISSPLPIMEYSAYSGTDPWGGRFKFDGNLLNLYRQSGRRMQRGVGEVSWQRPWNTSWGQVYTVFASTRGDLYGVQHGNHREDVSDLHPHDKEDSARFFPQTGLNWRWPFINSWCGQSFVVQPVAQLILAPSQAIGSSSRKIPNEDSQDPEFNDANLFSPDRFPGYDKIDTGSRVVYGGEMLTTGTLLGDVELFLGQSYSLSGHEHGRNLQGFTLQDSKHVASDYVGRFEASPYSWLSVNYRFRLDQKSLHSRIAEAGGSLGPAIAKLTGNYLFISHHLGAPGERNFSQLNLTFSSQFTKYWSFTANIIKDFRGKTEAEKAANINHHHGILSQGMGVTYKDDCFLMTVGVTQQNYRARDVKPGTLYTVSVWLKNIGDYSISGNPFDALFGNKRNTKK